MSDSTITIAGFTQAVSARGDIALNAVPANTATIPHIHLRKGAVTLAFNAATAVGTSAPIDMTAHNRALIHVLITVTSGTPAVTLSVSDGPTSTGPFLIGVDSNTTRLLTGSAEYLVSDLNAFLQVAITAIAGSAVGTAVTINVTPLA